MHEYTQQLEALEAEMRDDKSVTKYGSETLLGGIDYLCRILFGLVLHDLTPEFWDRQDPSKRREILFHYRELGRQAERLYDTLYVPVPFWGYKFSGDLEVLAQGSGAAQQIASMPYKSKDLDAAIMKSLTHATVSALISAAPLFLEIPTEKKGYYLNHIEGGLGQVRLALSPRRKGQL